MDEKNSLRDEVLELVWTKKEEGGITKEEILKCQDPEISTEFLEELIKEDYISEIRKGARGEINLTEKGIERASKLIRSHRLAERLFCDVLNMADEFLEKDACTFEHILSPEVIEAICTILGHPRECPHGRPIPKGDCCKKGIKEVERIVLPLNELKSGQKGKIVYIATKHHQRLDHLTGLGVTPGSEILVHQTFPAFMIRVAETDIAIDKDVLKDIFVLRK